MYSEIKQGPLLNLDDYTATQFKKQGPLLRLYKEEIVTLKYWIMVNALTKTEIQAVMNRSVIFNSYFQLSVERTFVFHAILNVNNDFLTFPTGTSASLFKNRANEIYTKQLLGLL